MRFFDPQRNYSNFNKNFQIGLTRPTNFLKIKKILLIKFNNYF
jgi:hypothetical protein